MVSSVVNDSALHPPVNVGLGSIKASEHERFKVASVENTGAVVSITEMICEREDALSASSVAVQVRVNVYSPSHDPGVKTSLNVMVEDPQLSVAVTSEEGVGTFEHSTVASSGTPDNTGAVVS